MDLMLFGTDVYDDEIQVKSNFDYNPPIFGKVWALFRLPFFAKQWLLLITTLERTDGFDSYVQQMYMKIT